MTDGKRNGEARVEDFLLPEFEDVTLPSGLQCTLRPPSSLEFFAELGTLPGRLASAAQGEKPEPLAGEDLVEWTWKFLSKLFVHPKFSPHPGPGEYHPNRLRHDDRVFLDRWATKYLPKINSGGAGGAGPDLETFRGEPGSDADSRADGGAVEDAPQRDAARPSVVLGD